jgi:CheY-like chemotaxis protein
MGVMSVLPKNAVEARRRRVLFVEDHSDLRATYERVFRHHEIVLVETGEEAIEAIKRQRDFDLVVCDLVLPGIDGIEVFKQARALHPELATRFVFATGIDSRQQFQEVLETIDVPILEKPFGMGLLRDMLERAAKR